MGTLVKVTTKTAPAGKSILKLMAIPTRHKNSPIVQPIINCDFKSLAKFILIKAGTTKNENTSKIPAIPTLEVITTPKRA